MPVPSDHAIVSRACTPGILFAAARAPSSASSVTGLAIRSTSR